MKYPKLLIPNTINLNDKLLDRYTSLIAGITRDGDDQNYGSCATKDTEVLQLLSRRIHL
jgi:chorismate mutase